MKSLILPKLIYISSLLPTPNNVIKELNKLIFDFLWKGKDKVTRLSAINNYEEDGLKMTGLRLSDSLGSDESSVQIKEPGRLTLNMVLNIFSKITEVSC